MTLGGRRLPVGEILTPYPVLAVRALAAKPELLAYVPVVRPGAALLALAFRNEPDVGMAGMGASPVPASVVPKKIASMAIHMSVSVKMYL
jgi:hypothetical protein